MTRNVVLYFQTRNVANVRGGEGMATKMLNKDDIAQNLKDLRIEKGKTVAQVSVDTGIGETALRNYECGLRIPRYTAMFKIAKYYGRSVDSIFFQ